MTGKCVAKFAKIITHRLPVCDPACECDFTLCQSTLGTFSFSQFQFHISRDIKKKKKSFLFPLTSLSWLAIVSRVTGLLGLLLSLTEAMCPFLMIGMVASGWPGVCGCGTAWPCPADEASLEPSVRYCLTCWFWVWWRWNLEFSRWLCTCSQSNHAH